jgi:2-amino-4-hydroxy-6-hydroxymethyldihydropteridine diphosphokinase
MLKSSTRSGGERVERVFICLGSNMGDRVSFLRRAVEETRMIGGVRIVAMSSVYETEPVGVKEQPQFLNMVLELSADRAPRELLHEFKAAERRIGRTRSERWGPREIDIDLVYAGSMTADDADFKLPHPERTNRRFVLVPLAEIAEDFVDPLERKTISQLLRACGDASRVAKSTEELRSNTAEA